MFTFSTIFDLFYCLSCVSFFFFNDTAPSEIYTLSLHDALPIWAGHRRWPERHAKRTGCAIGAVAAADHRHDQGKGRCGDGDRKSTRLNSSHRTISYAVFCLKKKKNTNKEINTLTREA